MASGLRQAVRNKLTPELQQFIAQHYGRFGDQQNQYAAYERRQERKRRFGIDNLNDANSQQIRRAAEADLIGGNAIQQVGAAASPGVPNQGNPFGQGSGKVSPMVAALHGPGFGGSPTPGRPMVPPPMDANMPPGGFGGPPMQGTPPQFTPQSPLAVAMGGAVRDFSLPPRKRIRNSQTGY